MIGYNNVLCLCPAGRFFLVSLTLSTWTHVERYVVTEDEAHDLTSFDAVIVMDRFVRKDLVDQLLRALPVVVLAWNGLFEIDRYRQTLGSLDVIYMGTDAQSPQDLVRECVRYLPTINGDCSFIEWHARFRDRRQFSITGANLAYRLRWLRMQIYANRALCVALSAGAAALKRPRSISATIRSGVLRDRLVWAGNCNYDAAPYALEPEERESLRIGVAAMRNASTPLEELDAGVALMTRWKQIVDLNARVGVHETVYMTNTLLRWTVLKSLLSASKASTWFFGVDNVELDLAFELDVYSLVPPERIGFVDFGGKTSETSLYPRSLQLLARQCYVIGIPATDIRSLGRIVKTLERHIEVSPGDFFSEIEMRRRHMYEQVTSSATLAQVQERVWSDFARYCP